MRDASGRMCDLEQGSFLNQGKIYNRLTDNGYFLALIPETGRMNL